jgi:hypothetical protein
MAIAAAVMAGLRKLPREAVPETLEIVMQATGVDSVTLLSGLLRSVPGEIEEAQVKSYGYHDCFVRFCGGDLVPEASTQSRCCQC